MRKVDVITLLDISALTSNERDTTKGWWTWLSQDSSDNQIRLTREFNLVLSSTLAVALVFLFVSAVFGDALVDIIDDQDQKTNVRVPVWERNTLPYQTEGDFSIALELGPYEILPTENEWNSTHHFVEYTLPIEEGGAAPDDAVISLAVWRPNVPEGRLSEVCFASENPLAQRLAKYPNRWPGSSC